MIPLALELFKLQSVLRRQLILQIQDGVAMN